MCKKIFVIVILVLVIGVLVPNCALATNSYSSGEVTIDTPWSGTLQNELTRLGAFPSSITKLTITAGTITDADVDWMTKNLSSLKDLNISGSSAFEDNNLPDYAFSGFASRGYGLTPLVMNKLETVVIDPTNSELHFGFASFYCVEVDNSQLVSISIPNAKTFGSSPFFFNDNLTIVNLPNATTFGDHAFSYNLKLASINLPSAESFAKNAFSGCELLYSINLPSIKSLGEHMFYCVNSGKQLILPAIPPTLHQNTFQMYFNASKGGIIIPEGAENVYNAVNDGGKPGWYGFPIKQKHGIVYNGNGNDGGTVPVDSNKYYEGDTVTVLGNTGNLTRTGYTYGGWIGVGSTFTMGDTNRTIYAKWNPIQYTVTFNTNGGNNINDMVRNYDTTISQPYCSRAGYNLVGWYKEDTFVNKVTFPYTVTANQRLHAKWEVAQRTINFNTDGGSYVSSVTQNPNTTIDVAPVTTRTGHTFDGWYTDSMFFSKVTFPYIITYNTTLYAKWIPDQYTISFNTNGGSSVSVITQGYDSMIDEPICSKVGHYLEGWYTEATFADENRVFFPYIINGDATLHAKWAINQYVIDFQVAGGSPVDPIFQNYNTTIDTSPVTTKAGYILEGWYKEDTFINKVTFPYTITDNAILYAKWIGVPYTISFDVAGGSAVNAITQGYNSTINEPVCNKAGHSFMGWYTEATFVNKVTFPYIVEGNATLYAKWEIEQYTINFDVGGGSAVNAVTQNYNTTIDICPVTTKANYTFDGWYKESTFENKAVFPYTITGNAMLYAKWNEVKVGDITLSSNNETYNIGVTGFITVNLTPSNALNKNIIISNLNSNVASATVDSMDPHKIWIEALEEGRTEIKVVTEDGSVSKTCVVVVVKPDVAEPETPQGGIVGALVDSNGDPLVGYYITMHSTPVTVVTDSNGKFSFPNIQFTSHTMIVESPVRSELARFAVSMVQGSNTTSTINNIINSIDITYANTTLNINVDLQAANPMATDFNIAQVGFTQKPNHVPVVNGRVENPATGERVENSNIRLLIISIVLIGLFASLMTISYRKYRDK